MGFDVFKDPLAGATFVICIFGIPTCTLATHLRFIGTRRAGRQVGTEDWFALLALLSFLLHATLALWTVIKLNGRSRYQDGQYTPEGLTELSKVGYVFQLNFPFNPTFAKLSLLALYYRIFYISRQFVRWMWTLALLQIGWFISILVVRIMFCLPISATWTPGASGHCINASLLLAVGESVNAAIAFAMIVLAMCMVRTLAMSNSTKWKLRLLFVLGGLTGVIDIISIAEAYGTINLNLRYLCLSTIQMMANTICCCAPVYRSIIPDFPILGKIKNKMSLFSKSSMSSSGSSNRNRNPQGSLLPTLTSVNGTVLKRGVREQDWIRLKGPSPSDSFGTELETRTPNSQFPRETGDVTVTRMQDV